MPNVRSDMFISWPKSLIMSPFQSMAICWRRNQSEVWAYFCGSLVDITWLLLGLTNMRFVLWGCYISYAEFHGDRSSISESTSEKKTMGVSSTPLSLSIGTGEGLNAHIAHLQFKLVQSSTPVFHWASSAHSIMMCFAAHADAHCNTCSHRTAADPLYFTVSPMT